MSRRGETSYWCEKCGGMFSNLSPCPCTPRAVVTLPGQSPAVVGILTVTIPLSDDVRRLLLDIVLLNGEQDAAPSLHDMAERASRLLGLPSSRTVRRP